MNTTTETLTAETIKQLMATVLWLVNEANAGRKTMAEADAYHEGVMRLVKQSVEAKAGN